MTRFINAILYCCVLVAAFGFVADDVALTYGAVIVGGIVSMIDYLRDNL
jgi:hypothetical protein